MFQSGDIVQITQSNELWIIIERDLPSETDSNEYFWRMRNREHGKRLPNVTAAWSGQLSLICRPFLYVNQELFYRDLFVKVIKNDSIRVKCTIIGKSDYQPLNSWNSDIYVGRQLQILKSALIESNILSFISE